MQLNKPSAQLPQTEWCHPFRAENATPRGKQIHIEANAEQCKAIAERLEIVDVKSIAAGLTLTLQNAGHILYITGTFKAEVVQECVVTGEPLDSIIEEQIEAWYADHDKAIPFARAQQKIKAIEEGDEVQMLDEKDDPEAMIDGQVDLGEVVVQFLSLAINPYPKKDGLPDMGEVELGADKKPTQPSLRPNPFAALKNWRPKD